MLAKWSVETLNEIVDAELELLPADMRARFIHISRLVEEFGLDRIREPHIKHIRGVLWEMRMKGRDGISRALYVTAAGRRVVVVPDIHQENRQYSKSRDQELALRPAKEIS